MCGIFCVVSDKFDASEHIMAGLKRLQYRGYDSWGVAIINNNKIYLKKRVGAIGNADVALPKSQIGIGHTRWATHGEVSIKNAHPHLSSDAQFAVAHNGIVENYAGLKKELIKNGYKFRTQTDTETIVALIEQNLKSNISLIEAARLAFLKLYGRNTITVLSRDGDILGLRNGSPLVVGFNKKNNNYYFSSDTLSFAPFVDSVYVVDNGQMIFYSKKNIGLIEIKSGKKLPFQFKKIDLDAVSVNKNGYKHFMLKEINETPNTIRMLLKQNRQKYIEFADIIKKSDRVYTIGSGTAGAAAAQIAYYLRTFGKIHAQSLIAAETNEYIDLLTSKDLIIAPSQSGETADVIEILEKAKKRRTKIASVVNMPGSMITRLSDIPFMSQAGAEICVMTTKVFTSQIAWGYLIAKAVENKFDDGLTNLQHLSKIIEDYLINLKKLEEIKTLALKLKKNKNIFLMGKAQNLAIVNEGMIKIIEGSYIHAHSIPAGDLKHYAITLMEKGISVITVLSKDNVYSDVINAAHEVKTRGAEVIGIAPESSDLFNTHIQTPDLQETSAIFNIIPLQLLAYYMAVSLGNNVDRPRNIAKSVTVK